MSKPQKGYQCSQKEPERSWLRQDALNSLSLGDAMVSTQIQVIDGVDTVDASGIKNGSYTILYGVEDDSLVGVIFYGEGKFILSVQTIG